MFLLSLLVCFFCLFACFAFNYWNISQEMTWPDQISIFLECNFKQSFILLPFSGRTGLAVCSWLLESETFKSADVSNDMNFYNSNWLNWLSKICYRTVYLTNHLVIVPEGWQGTISTQKCSCPLLFPWHTSGVKKFKSTLLYRVVNYLKTFKKSPHSKIVMLVHTILY